MRAHLLLHCGFRLFWQRGQLRQKLLAASMHKACALTHNQSRVERGFSIIRRLCRVEVPCSLFGRVDTDRPCVESIVNNPFVALHLCARQVVMNIGTGQLTRTFLGTLAKPSHL